MRHLKTISSDHPGRIALPSELITQLGLAVGQWVEIIATPEGLLIKPADDTFQQQISIAEQVMEERQDMLRWLAQN